MAAPVPIGSSRSERTMDLGAPLYEKSYIY